MRKTERILIGLFLVLFIILFPSCNSSKSQLLGVGLSDDSKVADCVLDAEYYEVSVKANGESRVVFKTPNSVFPSILQIAVPKNSSRVEVKSFAVDSNGRAVLLGSGESEIKKDSKIEVSVNPIN